MSEYGEARPTDFDLVSASIVVSSATPVRAMEVDDGGVGIAIGERHAVSLIGERSAVVAVLDQARAALDELAT